MSFKFEKGKMVKMISNNNIDNSIERFNKRNQHIRNLYNKLICPEILKILGNYGITTITGVASVAMMGVAIIEPDLFPEEYVKEIMGSLLVGGAASGLFSLEFFTETKEKRKERYANITKIIERKNEVYDICECNDAYLHDVSSVDNSKGRR